MFADGGTTPRSARAEEGSGRRAERGGSGRDNLLAEVVAGVRRPEGRGGGGRVREQRNAVGAGGCSRSRVAGGLSCGLQLEDLVAAGGGARDLEPRPAGARETSAHVRKDLWTPDWRPGEPLGERGNAQGK